MTAERLRLSAEAVRLGAAAADKADAIDQCGRLLLELGAVEEGYLPAMHEREHTIATYIGEGVAIPHGTNEARSLVRRTALAVVQFPDGVDWDGSDVRVAIGIAASGEEHIGVLSALATTLSVPEQAALLRTTTSVDAVIQLLTPAPENDPAEPRNEASR
ncbi:PTS system IIA component (Fru family) [Murinocardiopsis flavida]|uniref:Mannitol-specific phosphotransferase enzyme IIA component n=1 Tax=Murinocardiopsis flavida TaxID=645275 RepID=A0A2P8DQU5_9ACTN|nr:PTS sugar transporter subunit IIA [Murinocardiopsis flavida]PSK99544.1 PTS system IIA component (Fru family) [Murinocardiopsis flavida]